MKPNTFLENSVSKSTASLKDMSSVPPMSFEDHQMIRRMQVENRRRAEDVLIERRQQKSADFL